MTDKEFLSWVEGQIKIYPVLKDEIEMFIFEYREMMEEEEEETIDEE